MRRFSKKGKEGRWRTLHDAIVTERNTSINSRTTLLYTDTITCMYSQRAWRATESDQAIRGKLRRLAAPRLQNTR